MPTNRDLYLAIANLRPVAEMADRSLETYLVCLRKELRKSAHEAELVYGSFVSALTEAFTNDAPEVEDGASATADGQYQSCETILSNQILDLREMKAAGILDNEYRYFGMSAPSGRYWYNFDPMSYLECGCAGSVGGWEEGDDTERSFVPGEVVFVDEDGQFRSADPRDFPDPEIDLTTIPWSRIEQFLWAGQNYE